MFYLSDIIYLANFFFTVTFFEMFYRSDRFSFKSSHFKNPIRPTLTNVLQIRKVWLFVTLLMFYRSEWLGFAPSQNVLQIRTPRFSFFQMFYRSGDTHQQLCFYIHSFYHSLSQVFEAIFWIPITNSFLLATSR